MVTAQATVGEALASGLMDRGIERVASVDCGVLIRGETGSGKGVLARRLHASSRRAGRPFVVADCSAMPAALFESQMFGHVRGAFTGAASDRQGLIRAASGGTLFLDEVGELAPECQAKLLTLLEDRTVLPVGGDRRVGVDIRVMAATHRDLVEMVAAGEFREDLFYRLAVIELEVPPLRRRRREIPGLVSDFIESKASLLGCEPRPASDGFMRALLAYNWPGNIRELGNCIERALVLSTGSALGVESLPDRLRRGDGPERSAEPMASRADEARDALRRAAGNKARAARMLGISRRHIYRLLVEDA